MPFAASILSEDEKKYLINKKNISEAYIIFTCPRYYQLIKKKKKRLLIFSQLIL